MRCSRACVGRAVGDTPYPVPARPNLPALPPRPAYSTAAAIPGLTPSDSALLAILIEEALAAEFLIVTWPVARAKAEERGMTPTAIDEAFAALENRRYLKVRSVAGGPPTLELSAPPFPNGLVTRVPQSPAPPTPVLSSLPRGRRERNQGQCRDAQFVLVRVPA